MTATCYGGKAHLAGLRRMSGELVCARCGRQLEPPSRRRQKGGQVWNLSIAQKRRRGAERRE